VACSAHNDTDKVCIIIFMRILCMIHLMMHDGSILMNVGYVYVYCIICSVVAVTVQDAGAKAAMR
jgi:hypothetical protein